MAVYYFHLRDHVDSLLDPDGRELAGDKVPGAALEEARALIAADARAGHIDLNQRIEVEDLAGTIVHRVEFVDAVQVLRMLPPAA